MKMLENEKNMTIIESGDNIYLFSYKSLIARANNTLGKNYGLTLTNKWDYSNTTLKQLYNFIELYTTQRDNTWNTIAYMLGKQANKKKYIEKLIKENVIILKNESEVK